MNSDTAVFVVPTYRLRDVAETIEEYDEHFWSNGHSIKMIVFDDSSLANHEKYYPLLERTRTVNELYYVGPREKEQFLAFLNKKLLVLARHTVVKFIHGPGPLQKEQFLAFLNKKLRDRKLESLVRNLFRPSYGGNRNFTLMYTLGVLMI